MAYKLSVQNYMYMCTHGMGKLKAVLCERANMERVQVSLLSLGIVVVACSGCHLEEQHCGVGSVPV